MEVLRENKANVLTVGALLFASSTAAEVACKRVLSNRMNKLEGQEVRDRHIEINRWVAWILRMDRHGTATVLPQRQGEDAMVNYRGDENTTFVWHIHEATGDMPSLAARRPNAWIRTGPVETPKIGYLRAAMVVDAVLNDLDIEAQMGLQNPVQQ